MAPGEEVAREAEASCSACAVGPGSSGTSEAVVEVEGAEAGVEAEGAEAEGFRGLAGEAAGVYGGSDACLAMARLTF